MSMFDKRGKQPMPKPNNITPMPNVPMPPERPERPRQPPIEQTYAEEALRAAQRAIDQVREIERLNQELTDWQRRALLGEAEIKRLEQREFNLTGQLERRVSELAEERDLYRFRLNNLEAQFESAGAIILKCLDTARREMQGSPQVNLTQLAGEIERFAPPQAREQARELPPNEPMPRAVTAGPREPDDASLPPVPPQTKEAS